jgi:NAD(P)-dependent dehydrogenase (short-subunit alcohol dehydrogenase family)
MNKKKTIVITGVTGVLGNLLAKTFAERGDNLALLDNNYDKLDSLVRDLDLPEERLFKLVIDLRDGEAVQSAAEVVSAKFDGVSALIHLVGGWVGGRTIPESSVEDFEFMLNQHAWTTFHLFKSFAPFLAGNGWGRVITLSIPLLNHPKPGMGVYAAGKAAQEALVQTLAEELKDKGVTANVIYVKSIDINGEGGGTSPAEIISTILYLFSDDAAKINGRKIPLY